jgi:hypothetical protein
VIPRRLLGAALGLLVCAGLSADEFYVAPNAAANGNGSFANPWRLQTALDQPAAVDPGDTIWLRGGTYNGDYVSWLQGTAANPIVVRQYPGERAIIDGGDSDGYPILLVRGNYSWFWGFEIMSSDPDRVSSQASSWPTDIGRGAGFEIYQQAGVGTGVKFINLIVHDTRGNGLPSEAVDAEVYGCLIYYNGWDAPDRGHGHGVYVQNETGTKRVVDNIIFQQFSHGYHAYGSASAHLDNLHVEGNILFNNGNISSFGSARNLLLGGDNVAHTPTLLSNSLYYAASQSPETAFKMGYGAGCSNATINQNYVANDTEFSSCQPSTMTGNSYYGDISGFSQSQYPSNTYYSSRPTGIHVRIRPNQFEAGRAHIAVYNWNLAASVSVDLSSVLAAGTSFEIRNAQNYFGTPVVSGVYTGGTVSIPLAGLPSAAPVGRSTPAPSGPEFNAFVLVGAQGPFQFLDVFPNNPHYANILTLAASGITAGCGGGNFCPNSVVLRDQSAVFLLKSDHGASWTPPPATGAVFSDVPANAFAAAWIEALANEDISNGCGGGKYCPRSALTRAQMAVLLLKTLEGPGYTPPSATGTVFSDVPAGSFAAAWIEELADRGITSGCGGGKYCPTASVTRGQLATFLVNTFSLQ